jgi:hypothetical protein
MRLRKLCGLGAAVLGLALAVPTVASAITLGTLATADPGPCSLGATSAWILQTNSTTALYTVPAGGGLITSWSTSFGPSGAPVEFIVAEAGTLRVVGVDQETLPSPIPPGNVSTFNLSHPIVAVAGDQLGLFYSGSSNTRCFQMSPAATDSVAAGTNTPAVGGTLTPATTGNNILVNVQANLLQSTDLAITGAVSPNAVSTGDIAQFTFQVTANPAGAGTFTDTLPAGLQPTFAAAGTNTCTVSGQVVNCPLSSVPATVNVAVRGASPGTYTNTASVTSSLTDTNPGNNTVSNTLMVVNRPPTPQCTVPKLKGAPLKVAKSVLPLVNCKVGKVKKAKSKSVPKGDVISTNPGGGKKLTAGTKVAIKTSSGKPKKKAKK